MVLSNLAKAIDINQELLTKKVIVHANSSENMRVKVKYLGRTMELFGLSQDDKEEIIHLPEKSRYKDVLKKIEEKFFEANRGGSLEDYDVFNDIVVFSEGRILRNIEERLIDHLEIVVAPLVAGG